jgi:rare lipoprotein A (peptidoglycan hydrolase)
MLRAALTAGAMSLVLPISSAAAPSTATIASTDVKRKRMHVRAGKRVVLTGLARPGTAGVSASLQIKRDGRWRTLDRARTGSEGRYTLRDRVGRPMSVPARVRVGDHHRRVGRLNVYRTAYASWYGPGLYGNHLGCGGRLSPGRLGVAHKTLPCGARVTLRRGTRTVRVRVIDRGPYVPGREFDLTEATAQRLGFRGHGSILTTR